MKAGIPVAGNLGWVVLNQRLLVFNAIPQLQSILNIWQKTLRS